MRHDDFRMHTSGSQTGPAESMRVQCCIAGGGPAGMVLGFLLARAGVDVVVLEKHADFLRDFRGDTIHPSTLEIMHELGLLEDFLRLPHQELREVGLQIAGGEVTMADFSHLPTRCKFIAMMPQWDFLNFIAERGRRFPQFQLRMQAGVTDLLEENGRVVGVRAKTPAGELEVRADLTVGADGRNSTVRELAGLEVIDRGAPIDVLWMRIPRHPEDPARAMGRFNAGKALAMLYRGDYWQCAYLIPKGEFDAIQQRGLPAFREDLASVMPFVRARTSELKSWDDIKLLSVRVDYLRQWWRPGLLCIGDAAHAMSPAGGVGINLAIQDAVAAANMLAEPLLHCAAIDEHLNAIQKRREFPTQMIQRLQIFAHKRLISRALAHTAPLKQMPLPLKLFQWFPVLRRIPARMIGVGSRPEHVRTPEARS